MYTHTCIQSEHEFICLPCVEVWAGPRADTQAEEELHPPEPENVGAWFSNPGGLATAVAGPQVRAASVHVYGRHMPPQTFSYNGTMVGRQGDYSIEVTTWFGVGIQDHHLLFGCRKVASRSRGKECKFGCFSMTLQCLVDATDMVPVRKPNVNS